MPENTLGMAILGECLESVVDYRGKTPPKSPCGIPTITAANVKSGRIDMSTISYVSEKTYWEWSTRGFPEATDVLITTEAPVGEVAPFPSDQTYLITRRVFAMRGKKGVLDNAYLLYTCLSSIVQDELQSRIRGSTVPRVLKTDILGLQIPLPPLAEQKAIAHILGTLDDKIELNRKTNATLEAMAKALFKSWFVDFDPVRAKAEGRSTGLPDEISDLFPDSFEDSELGEIPRGWSICSVNDLCDWVSSGGTPSRSRNDFWENGTIPWFKTGELNDAPLLDSVEKINELALGNSSCKLWEEGTILFAIYASPTVGRLGVLTESGTSNQAAAGLKAKATFGTPFLRRTLLFSRDELQNIAVGAAQQNINVQILKDHKVVNPGAVLASYYSNATASMDEQQICLAKSVRELCSLRDTLLPKLISGVLRIPDAEKMLEEVGF
jgi:type I restriction enzyme, S subunit